MPSPKSTCSICYNEYNQTNHVPRIIPSCGHTLCSSCLVGIISQSPVFHCPIDRITYNVATRNVSSFPLNYALQDIINEDVGYDLCPHHEERMKLACVVDKCKVCDDCVLYGSHRGHEIRPLKKLEAEATKMAESLEAKLGEIKAWQRMYMNALKVTEQALLGTVKTRFDNFKAILHEKEEGICKEIQSYFEMEQKDLNSSLGDGSSIQKNLQNEIADLRDAAQEKDFIKVLQMSSSQNVPNFNSNFFEQRLQDLNQRLQEIETLVDQPLMSQIILFKGLEVKLYDRQDASRGAKLPRSSSDAFLKSYSQAKELSLDRIEHTDIFTPLVSSARNGNREQISHVRKVEGNKGFKMLRDTFIPNSSPRSSIKSRPRIVMRDNKEFVPVNKTTLQW